MNTLTKAIIIGVVASIMITPIGGIAIGMIFYITEKGNKP